MGDDEHPTRRRSLHLLGPQHTAGTFGAPRNGPQAVIAGAGTVRVALAGVLSGRNLVGHTLPRAASVLIP